MFVKNARNTADAGIQWQLHKWETMSQRASASREVFSDAETLPTDYNIHDRNKIP